MCFRPVTILAPSMLATTSRRTLVFPLLAAWALVGVLVILGQAIVRLAPLAWEPIRLRQLDALGWLAYGAWALVNAYLEGYRGFHLRFVPRVLRRIMILCESPNPIRVVAAPLFVMGFFGGPKSDRRAAWIVTLVVVMLVTIVHRLPQPYRGIVDVGVVVGLAIGWLSLFVRGVALFFRVPEDLARAMSSFREEEAHLSR